MTVASDGTRTLWDAASGARASSFPGNVRRHRVEGRVQSNRRDGRYGSGANVSLWETESGTAARHA